MRYRAEIDAYLRWEATPGVSTELLDAVENRKPGRDAIAQARRINDVEGPEMETQCLIQLANGGRERRYTSKRRQKTKMRQGGYGIMNI